MELTNQEKLRIKWLLMSSGKSSDQKIADKIQVSPGAPPKLSKRSQRYLRDKETRKFIGSTPK